MDKADWLPVAAPTLEREPAHRAFPKLMETWDIERIKKDFADAGERMKAAGVDGVEFESFGHLMSPILVADEQSARITNTVGSLENRMRFSLEVLAAVRERVGPDFILGVRYVRGTKTRRRATARKRASRFRDGSRTAGSSTS